MEKPRIRITWHKTGQHDLGLRETPIYTLFLPYLPYGPEYPNDSIFGNCSSCNPNDCLALMICNDIEIGGLQELGNRTLIFNEGVGWERVYGAPKPKYIESFYAEGDEFKPLNERN